MRLRLKNEIKVSFYFSFQTGRWNRPTLLNRCVLRSSTFGKRAIYISASKGLN